VTWLRGKEERACDRKEQAIACGQFLVWTLLVPLPQPRSFCLPQMYQDYEVSIEMVTSSKIRGFELLATECIERKDSGKRLHTICFSI